MYNKNNLVLLAVGMVAFLSHWAANKSLPLCIAAALLLPLSVQLLIVACRSGHLLKMGLLWLATPYFILAFHWLNFGFALGLIVVLVSLLWQCRDFREDKINLSSQDQLAIVLGSMWFSLAGIGGVGYQSIDWIMHNGRLVDLFQYDWPVIYSEGKLLNSEKWPAATASLTGYFAFQLPAAAVGKWFGSLDVARLAQYVWAWLGFVTLLLSGKLIGRMQQPLLLFTGIALFAGTDIALFFNTSIIQLISSSDLQIATTSDSYDETFSWLIAFWAAGYFDYFFGVFLPPATQFHLAPNQIIALWLATSAVLFSHRQQLYPLGLVWIGFLFFWSPFGAIGLMLLWLILSFQARSIALQIKAWRIWLPLLVLFIYFVVFYRVYDENVSSGVFRFAWQTPHVANFWWKWLVFHAITWGPYGLVIVLGWQNLSTLWRQALIASAIGLVLLSLIEYGLFSDLKMRATAVPFFVLMLGLFEVFRQLWLGGKRYLAVLLIVFASMGTLLHIPYLMRDVLLFNKTYEDTSVVDYPWGYEFMRQTNDFFMCHMSANDDYCQR